MVYQDMEKGFQYAFSAALSAYRRGSTAIGCAIMNGYNECISTGENSIYANDYKEKVNRHHLAHAEINAILKTGSGHYGADSINNVLYTTMEPCIMCFGAMVMCYYKNVKFAAFDPYAGATNLNETKQYGLQINGPYDGLQEIQVALSVYRGLKIGFLFVNRTISMYKEICAAGVDLGQTLYKDSAFNDMMNGTEEVDDEIVIDYMYQKLQG